MNVEERYKVAKEKRLCFSCLAGSHPAKDCQKSRKCGIDGCDKMHNKLLHQKRKNVDPEKPKEGTNMTSSVEPELGLLQVARVRVFGAEGRFEDTLAACDSCSTQTWVDEDLMERMHITGDTVSFNVTGIHGTQRTTCTTAQVKIGPANASETNSESYAISSRKNLLVGRTVYNLTELKQKYPHLKCVPFKEIDLSKIKVILGQNAYEMINPIDYKKAGRHKPWAVRLPLGWTVSGPLPTNELKFHGATAQVACAEDVQLADVVKKWWDMESYGTLAVADKRSQEDKLAAEILNSTIKFNGERYEVGLLWNGNEAGLCNNYSSALGQLKSLQRRLLSDPQLFERYNATIVSDLSKGYVSILNTDELKNSAKEAVWYVPHHPVLNPHKPDKVRRVCNAASKFRGSSLNDMLLAGPDLLANLMGILSRFREKPIAMSADIEEMFLQVAVKPEDRNFLRFLWQDENGSVVTYQYNRHIFGAKSSPTCANFALQRCARDNAEGHLFAAHVAQHNFYMDDLLISLNDKEEAVQLKSDLTKLLAKGGFKLTKWATNFDEAVEREKALTILGLEWNNVDDTLRVCRGTHFEPVAQWTQRKVLSVVSSVFDPLGFLAPFVIRGRIIMKQIWQTKGQQWDTAISDSLSDEFSNWVAEINSGETFCVPRWYKVTNEAVKNELHVFGDASEDAFCAVAYLVSETPANERSVSFIMGKTRVAPVKHHTITKLKLMAAVTGNRLKDAIFIEH